MKTLKRLISILLAASVMIAGFTSVALAESVPPELTAEGVIAIDLVTGEVLYEKDPTAKLYPASTTKLLTALVVIENMNLDKVLTADDEVASTGGSRLGMKSGEQITAKDALWEMLIGSCNDLAVLLAKAVSGSVEQFAVLMNEKAAELGCVNTHFINPNGLHNDDHYTCAEDLARIAVACMKNQTIREIVRTEKYTYTRGKGAREPGIVETMYTSNWLLNDTSHVMYVGDVRRTAKYDGCIGIKTGWTSQSKGCLVAAAVKGDTTILTVVLKSNGSSNGSYERFVDSIKLLDWCFDNYRTCQVMKMGQELGTVSVKKGEFNKVKAVLSTDIFTTLTTVQQDSSVTTQVKLDDPVRAPFDQGTVCGKLEVLVDGEKVGEYDIVTASAMKEGGVLSIFGIEDATAKKIFSAIAIIIVLSVVSFVGYIVYLKIKSDRKKARKAARAKARAEAMAKEYDMTHRDSRN